MLKNWIYQIGFKKEDTISYDPFQFIRKEGEIDYDLLGYYSIGDGKEYYNLIIKPNRNREYVYRVSLNKYLNPKGVLRIFDTAYKDGFHQTVEYHLRKEFGNEFILIDRDILLSKIL